ncbi:hypothetical protein DPMN_103889 [Dreissena polymorpha]|uniref:Uncharacterized protein n=1 Tax=Dreissena polymorpha TaxID=45954 RepID=A0A9D4K166_DREPO|nr:hypothetical protein DPMN_103889 [Dreissena polymorpha]
MSYPVVFKYPLSHIIQDLSGVSFVDTVGCKVVKNTTFGIFSKSLRSFPLTRTVFS